MAWISKQVEFLPHFQVVQQCRRKLKWNVHAVPVWRGESVMEMKSANHLMAYLPILTTVIFCSPPTEASKLVMSYVAAVCGKGAEVNQVKEQLLQSNPVLEGKNLTEHIWVCYLSAFLLSWFGKLLSHYYLESKTIGDAFSEDSYEILLGYGEDFLRKQLFPSWRESVGS